MCIIRRQQWKGSLYNVTYLDDHSTVVLLLTNVSIGCLGVGLACWTKSSGGSAA